MESCSVSQSLKQLDERLARDSYEACCLQRQQHQPDNSSSQYESRESSASCSHTTTSTNPFHQSYHNSNSSNLVQNIIHQKHLQQHLQQKQHQQQFQSSEIYSSQLEVKSLEEAKSVIAALRARQRAQAHQMLACKRTLKLQVVNSI